MTNNTRKFTTITNIEANTLFNTNKVTRIRVVCMKLSIEEIIMQTFYYNDDDHMLLDYLGGAFDKHKEAGCNIRMISGIN